jgi:hypothetical protein
MPLRARPPRCAWRLGAIERHTSFGVYRAGASVTGAMMMRHWSEPDSDHVSIWIDERIQPLVPIDSSVFHLLLTRNAHAGVPLA